LSQRESLPSVPEPAMFSQPPATEPKLSVARFSKPPSTTPAAPVAEFRLPPPIVARYAALGLSQLLLSVAVLVGSIRLSQPPEIEPSTPLSVLS
jgi:hypothetical protein